MKFPDKLKSELIDMGYTPNESDTIYRARFNGTNYGVDFEKGTMFRFEDLERVEDPDDDYLKNLAALANRISPAPEPESREVSTVHKRSNFSVQYDQNQIDTIKNTVAKGADDDELKMFIHLASTYGLDPFLKEIFYSSEMKTIMTSRDGYLKVAQRDPSFQGIQSMAVCENDDFELDVINHAINHRFGKGDRGKVIGAWAIVYREGRVPVVAYADYSEYNKNTKVWNTYKSAMICKVAESFALKRQFGITGLVTTEEVV
jgi:phage recombination protein Bet